MLNLRITLDQDSPWEEYIQDDIVDTVFHLEDGTHQVIIKDVDDALVESLNPDELCEFFGFETEFIIATEVVW